MARKTCHNGTTTWFTRSTTFNQWTLTGSLLWIHGIRTFLPSLLLLLVLIVSGCCSGLGKKYPLVCASRALSIFGVLMLLTSSTIIQDIQAMCQTGLGTFAFYFFDPQDAAKHNVRGLLAAILIQLCDQKDDFLQVFSSLYSAHGDGSQQPSEDALTRCLKDMMGLSQQVPVYIIVDGLDCCPNSYGSPSPREQVLRVMKELIKFRFPHLRLCVTSRPEIDIRRVLKPLAASCMSLHNELGQVKDIAHYVKSVVDSDTTMRRWPDEDKQLVIDTLTQSGGMYEIIFVIFHNTFSRCDIGSNGLPAS